MWDRGEMVMRIWAQVEAEVLSKNKPRLVWKSSVLTSSDLDRCQPDWSVSSEEIEAITKIAPSWPHKKKSGSKI